MPRPAPQPALGGLAARAQLHPGKWDCCFKAALFFLHPLKACVASLDNYLWSLGKFFLKIYFYEF